MFTPEPQLQNTWDVCQVQPNTSNINQGVHDTLKVPTIDLSDANLNHGVATYIGLQQHQVPHETIRELSKQGKLFNDILERVVLPAGFKDSTPSKCEIIHMWIDGLKNAVTYVTFDECREPRLKLDCSLVYPGMTAGVYCPSLSSGSIAAPFSFEQEDK